MRGGMGSLSAELRRSPGPWRLMLPDHEIGTLLQTVEDAFELAKAGSVAAGYQLLSEGLQRACLTDEDGAPWGEEMVVRWQLAVDRYCDRWLVALP